ncbi:hypothetical protein ADIARSV_3076 [Arcticibacter svalbardensis MN12-7]|uniref:Uncharacterized protein n=1 Tax=Arcticibacter svalbardensis MN12-7 TaxID=1150600 RepID=R9GPV0_9SPHI|nr:hypothetical protein ADIARSV_3076 [Arcticibacter svalbardensis MN12-7]
MESKSNYSFLKKENVRAKYVFDLKFYGNNSVIGESTAYNDFKKTILSIGRLVFGTAF